MEITYGLIAALISIVCFGSYFVPMENSQEYKPYSYQWFMCQSIFISTLLLCLYLNEFCFSWFGLLAGALWCLGNLCATLAVVNGGLALSAVFWVGMGVSCTFLWGIVYFQESLNNMFAAILGLCLITYGAYKISQSSAKEKINPQTGIMFGCVAGLCFGSYYVPYKMSGMTPWQFIFSMSLGIIITSTFVFLLKPSIPNKKLILPAFTSGVFWNIANISSFFTVGYLGIILGYPLTQLSLFVSILWGILYFKEIHGKWHIKNIIIHSIILFLGAGLMLFAK